MYWDHKVVVVYIFHTYYIYTVVDSVWFFTVNAEASVWLKSFKALTAHYEAIYTHHSTEHFLLNFYSAQAIHYSRI